MNNDALVMNKAFRAILLGIEDVVGKPGMATILQQAGLAQFINNYPPSDLERGGQKLSDIGKVNHALFKVYGARGSRAIMQRVGRGQAKFGLEENAAIVAAGRVALKFMPHRRQIRFILDMAAKTINEQLDTNVTITEEGEFFYYNAPNCAYCKGWQNDSPVCQAIAGVIHGLLSGMLGADDFTVRETTCRAKGDDVCRFEISAQTLST